MKAKLAWAVAPLALLVALPASAEVSGQKAERPAPTQVVVTWSGPGPVDVYLADKPDASTSDAKLVSDDDADGRYEAAVAASARPYFLLRAADGSVVRVAERVLPLAQGSNFRDVGGYPGADGKHVRWGRIYRSGAQAMLTEEDVAAVGMLGLANLVDLRSIEERTLAPSKLNGVAYSAVGYSMMDMMGGGAPTSMGDERMHQVYRNIPVMLEPQYRVLFRTLLSGDGPVLYNCSAGQDRTGIATALILSALGVSRDVILADYHLSTTYRRPQFEMPRIEPAIAAANPVARFFASYQTDPAAAQPQPLYDSQHKALLALVFEELDARYGSVEGYLQQELGVGPADIARLRSMYLE